MRVETVIYWKDKNGPKKRGLLINEGEGPLLDMEGNIIEAGTIWDYKKETRWVLEIPEEVE